MTMKLFNYQVKASEFLQRTPRSILRLDTGLGKTAVCIDAVKEIKGVHNVLCIVPAFLINNWNREIKLWKGYEKSRFGDEINWTILSYTKMSSAKYLKSILETQFDMCICDEAHYLKNWESKRTQNIILKVLPKIKRVVLSTATPFVRSAADLHPLFSVCDVKKWGGVKQHNSFCEKFCKKKPNLFKRWKKFDYYGVNDRNAGELRIASVKYMFARKKSDVLKSLPEKIETDLLIDIGSEFKLRNMDTEEVIDVDTGKVSGGLRSILSKEGVKLGLEKVKFASKWIESIGKNQIVVFCKHKAVQKEFCVHLDKLEMNYQMINGDMNRDARDNIVTDFQASRVQVLVATMASCGVGINLTAASRCLFIELPWSYAELKQCEDRLHRIGQGNCVNIFRIVAKESIDELVVNVLNNKIEGEEITVGGM